MSLFFQLLFAGLWQNYWMDLNADWWRHEEWCWEEVPCSILVHVWMEWQWQNFKQGLSSPSWKRAFGCRVISRMELAMRSQRYLKWLRWDDLSWIRQRLSHKIRTVRWETFAWSIPKKTTRDETEARSYLAVCPEAAEHIWLEEPVKHIIITEYLKL